MILKTIKKVFFSDYTITLLSSVFSLFLGVILSGVFARILSQDDFLDYNLMARYFGFFQAVLCGSIGFGIIHIIKKTEENIIHRIIASFSLLYIIGYFSLLAFILIFFEDDGIIFNAFDQRIFLIGSLWFLGETFKHLFSFLLRGIDKFKLANTYMVSVNVGVIGLSLFITWQFELTYYVYQFLVGILAIFASVGVLFFVKEIKWQAPYLDKGLYFPVLAFSGSRWLENVFRMLFIVALVSYLSYANQQELASYIAILFTLIKMSESALQAFITVVFSKSAYMKKRELVKQFWFQTALALVFSAGLMIMFAFFGEIIIHIWLGKKYLFLTDSFIQLNLSLFAVISVFLYKGVFENFFKHSPLMILNFLMILSILMLPLLGQFNMENLIKFINIAFWVRLLVYLVIVVNKMKSLT